MLKNGWVPSYQEEGEKKKEEGREPNVGGRYKGRYRYRMMKKESELQVENDVRRWNAAVSVVVFCFVLGPGGGGW